MNNQYDPEKDPHIQALGDLKRANDQIIRLRTIISTFKDTLEPWQRKRLEWIEQEIQ